MAQASQPQSSALSMPNAPSMPVLTPAKVSLEQYHRMVEAGIWQDCHVELLHGVVVEMSPEGTPHAHKSSRTGEWLIRLLGERAHVRLAKPITLPHGSEPEPDIAIVQERGEEYLTHHPYPENIFWLIEYSHTSLQKDLEVKSKLYAAVGIPEYWVINLQTIELIVFREPVEQTPLDQESVDASIYGEYGEYYGEYQSQVMLTSGIIHPLAFPDLNLDVSRLLGS